MTYRALSGSTSGTVTADGLKTVVAVLLDGQIKQTSATTFSSNVATLAFAVPAETAASLIVQDLTYTAVADLGQDGNSITIAYVAGGTAGSEVVTVTGNAISVSMETGVSTATQIRTKINASAAAVALISCAVTGTGSTAQVAAAAAPLAGGVTGGARGSLICLGQS
jgi:hypothetical protein